MLLKATTIRTGAIHEAQVLQLKIWPRLNPMISKSEARVDVENKTVTFVCESGSLRPKKSDRVFFENLEKWVKDLLWDETTVTVRINDKIVFESKDEDEPADQS